MNMRENSYRMMTCYKTPTPGSPLIHPPPPSPAHVEVFEHTWENWLAEPLVHLGWWWCGGWGWKLEGGSVWRVETRGLGVG